MTAKFVATQCSGLYLYTVEWQSQEQVCVQPPPSAVNMTLRVFAAERRRLHHGARSCRSTSPALMALRGKPAGRRCCSRPMRQTDRRTDAQPLRRPCFAYCVVGVNNNILTESGCMALVSATTTETVATCSHLAYALFCDAQRRWRFV